MFLLHKGELRNSDNDPLDQWITILSLSIDPSFVRCYNYFLHYHHFIMSTDVFIVLVALGGIALEIWSIKNNVEQIQSDVAQISRIVDSPEAEISESMQKHLKK